MVRAALPRARQDRFDIMALRPRGHQDERHVRRGRTELIDMGKGVCGADEDVQKHGVNAHVLQAAVR